MAYNLHLAEKPSLEIDVASSGFSIEDVLEHRLCRGMSFTYAETEKFSDPSKPYAFSNALLRFTLKKDRHYDDITFLFHINYQYSKPVEIIQASHISRSRGVDMRSPPFAYKRKDGSIENAPILDNAQKAVEEVLRWLSVAQVYEASIEGKLDERILRKGHLRIVS